MSLAALETLRDDAPGIMLVAATDRNKQGDRYAERLAELATEAGCPMVRLMPEYDDWNEDMKQHACARCAS